MDGAVGAAVQVQQNQHARRFAQVVDPGDGLLAAVAALVQVDRALAGPADPADLVRDGPLVGVDAEPGSQRRDPVRLVRPDARGPDTCGDQPGVPVGGGVARYHQVDLVGAHGADEPAAGQGQRR